ncbi:MAG: hypothetical protein DRI72_08235 [Bacteroidetes bacterium]|nr:MAG: hypothetical protein DRI72_08235 [Bacteroidota bacterium]
MNRQSRVFILLLIFFIVVSAVKGQTSLGLNVGYINSFPILNYNSTSYVSGSADYNGSFFVATTYRKKAGGKLFLGASLHFHHYQLDYIEKNAIHIGLDEYTKDIDYTFNYLNLVLYPELVFGHRLTYYVNAGITAGLLLNANKSGTNTHMRMHSGGPDGYYPVYTVTEVEGDARSDIKSFSAGVHIGTGLRYHISDSWDINFDLSGQYILFPVEIEFTGSQVDLLISAGAEYTIHRKKNKPGQ